MKRKTITRRPVAKRRPYPPGPLFKLSDDLRAPSYRINMLDPENFTVALLGEFGYYRKTIAAALGLTMNQVNRRLKFAEVDPAAYRRGESVIGKMILQGVSKAGVPQLRQFAESILSEHLEQLGWRDARLAPALPEAVPPAAISRPTSTIQVHDAPTAQPV